ncbi:shikimate 5-dehydrogenase I alpha [alpha proteobacterium U9-1i]|nr:shikimate 5-dehydrogenase I alpha [alpha proteobacterium U9-1i]
MTQPARYAVIGDPVSHSLSPLMHNGWIADHGLNATYEARLLRAPDAVTAFRELQGFAGANVTVPHKEAAARAADGYTGAVANTLRWESDGRISAFNTDGDGFLDALTETAADWSARVGSVLILGAGGAARGVAEALADRDLIIANRSRDRAEVLSRSVPKARAVSWDALAQSFADADLIVNATTLGMSGAPSPDWPVAHAKPGAIVADIVYRPLETPLLMASRARGLATMDGLGMLIHQGARAFEIWFGVKPSVAKARARLLEALAQ